MEELALDLDLDLPQLQELPQAQEQLPPALDLQLPLEELVKPLKELVKPLKELVKPLKELQLLRLLLLLKVQVEQLFQTLLLPTVMPRAPAVALFSEQENARGVSLVRLATHSNLQKIKIQDRWSHVTSL